MTVLSQASGKNPRIRAEVVLAAAIREHHHCLQGQQLRHDVAIVHDTVIDLDNVERGGTICDLW